MGLVCRPRPNRTTPRVFRASDAARVVCAAIENGATQDQIEEELEARGCWTVSGDPECERKRREAKAIASELIDANNTTLAVADAFLRALEIVIRVALFGLRVIPQGRPVALALTPMVTQVASVRSNIAVRRAANDALFQRVANL